ncbi:MAG: GNAT family N-acetyltransferase [Planctomycetota bacterium]|nr:MAG: GNAT family N-acetyltransferase [Planctomycetota bacterium]
MGALKAPIPPLNLVRGGYRLRFAASADDLRAVQRLRYEVFNLELGEGLASAHAEGLDRDRFDPHCRHLMVEHLGSDRVVGTYRLQLAAEAVRAEGLYSATEFDLSTLPAGFLDEAVELGRACIAAGHRDQRVLGLLWKGLANFMLWHRKRRLFGCNSLTSREPAAGLRLFRQLEESGHLHPEIHVRPLPGLECTGPPAAEEVPLPKLFGIYLRYGARVLGPPAVDREFGTIDFLTSLDLAEVDPAVVAGYAR